MKIFMVDIETTGINPKTEEVLQIAILELTKGIGDFFWRPGRLYNRFLGTARRPSNKFAIEHMADLYAKCNLLLPAKPVEIQSEIKNFLTECGAPSMAVPVGINVMGFDIPFLLEKKYIKPHEQDVHNGDFHYRMYEMSGARALAMDILDTEDSKELEKQALNAYPEIILPEGGKDHQGDYDCYKQTKLLNGLIRICRGVNSRQPNTPPNAKW